MNEAAPCRERERCRRQAAGGIYTRLLDSTVCVQLSIIQSEVRSGARHGMDLLHAAAAVRFWFCLPCGVVRLVA